MIFILGKLGCDALNVKGWRRWYVALLAAAVVISAPLTWWLLLFGFAIYMQERRNARKKALKEASVLTEKVAV
jgi:hypothetical protein